MIRLAHPQLERVFEFEENHISTLIVESPALFRRFALDLLNQKDGLDGEFVLSQDYKPISFLKCSEIISDIISFDLNRKTLITKLCNQLDRLALDETRFADTQNLLSDIERYLIDLSCEIPGDFYFDKLNIGAIIKASGLQLANDTGDLLEQILNYIELVRELEGDKIFIFINMRSYFSHDEMQSFVDYILRKKLQLFLLDNREYPMLHNENRLVVDEDLCEI